MLQRDEEDLAVTQLPTHAPAAGWVDDAQLRRAQRARAGHPERGAERAEPAVPATAAPSREKMRKLMAERANVKGQRQALPLHDLRALEAL